MEMLSCYIIQYKSKEYVYSKDANNLRFAGQKQAISITEICKQLNSKEKNEMQYRKR